MLGGIGGRRKRGWQRVRWHHRLDGHEFQWTPGVGDGQRGLACCNSWGHKESDTTEQLNWTKLKSSQGGTLSVPFWCLCQKLSLSLLYLNKTLLHKSPEWSSLITACGSKSSPPQAMNPSFIHSLQPEPFTSYIFHIVVHLKIFPISLQIIQTCTLSVKM